LAAAKRANMSEPATPTSKDNHVAGAGSVENGAVLPSDNNNSNGGGAWEIEEMEPEERPRQGGAGASVADDVYVAVGKGGSSMAALSWALRRLTKPRSFVYLVHAFPVVTSIPTPCEQSQTLFFPPPDLSSSCSVSNDCAWASD
jgi:hypothetical protein